jgi:RHS repeat-associated protein
LFLCTNPLAEPSKYTHYLYDGGGNRVKKITRKQGGGYSSTTYIDGAFEYTKESSGFDAIPNLTIGTWIIGSYSSGGEQNILNLMGGATRRIGATLGDTTPAIKYNLDDHLGSSCIQLDTNGTTVSLEEYYPFGETSFGSYAKKRYRFCGKEKDEESGLYYYGMRYYSPWTCRFINVDPLAAKYAHLTPYAYADNKPINHTDLDGAETGSTTPTPTGGNNTKPTNFNINGLSEAGVSITGGKPNTQGTDVNGDNITDLHKVQEGENYGIIAKKYGVSVDNLRAWNGYGDKSVPTGINLIVSQDGYNQMKANTNTEIFNIKSNLISQGHSQDQVNLSKNPLISLYGGTLRGYYALRALSFKQKFSLGNGNYNWQGGINARTDLKLQVRSLTIQPFKNILNFTDPILPPSKSTPRFWLSNWKWNLAGTVSLGLGLYGMNNSYNRIQNAYQLGGAGKRGEEILRVGSGWLGASYGMRLGGMIPAANIYYRIAFTMTGGVIGGIGGEQVFNKAGLNLPTKEETDRLEHWNNYRMQHPYVER